MIIHLFVVVSDFRCGWSVWNIETSMGEKKRQMITEIFVTKMMVGFSDKFCLDTL